VSEPLPKPPPSGLSTVLFVFAAIDLILALALLAAGGFSWQFWAIALIGVGLAVYGLKERLFPARND
jgi:fatty acid desaturase